MYNGFNLNVHLSSRTFVSVITVATAEIKEKKKEEREDPLRDGCDVNCDHIAVPTGGRQCVTDGMPRNM